MLCKRFKECTRRKWPYRYLRKIDKMIRVLTLNKKSEGLPKEDQEKIARLKKEKEDCLRPVKIRITGSDKVQSLPYTSGDGEFAKRELLYDDVEDDFDAHGKGAYESESDSESFDKSDLKSNQSIVDTNEDHESDFDEVVEEPKVSSVISQNRPSTILQPISSISVEIEKPENKVAVPSSTRGGVVQPSAFYPVVDQLIAPPVMHQSCSPMRISAILTHDKDPLSLSSYPCSKDSPSSSEDDLHDVAATLNLLRSGTS